LRDARLLPDWRGNRHHADPEMPEGAVR